MKKPLLALTFAFLLAGCTGSKAEDPIERGLDGIANAIIFQAFIRSVLEK